MAVLESHVKLVRASSGSRAVSENEAPALALDAVADRLGPIASVIALVLAHVADSMPAAADREIVISLTVSIFTSPPL